MLNKYLTLIVIFVFIALGSCQKANRSVDDNDKSIVKSPDEMFASVKIPNDLSEVKKAMFEYYI